MKRTTLNYLIIAALIFVIAASIFTLAFILYKSEGNKVNSTDVMENVNIKEDIDVKYDVKEFIVKSKEKLLERRLYDNGNSVMLEYDADGFPTKRTWLLYQGDVDDNATTLFFYSSETKNIKAPFNPIKK